MRGNIKNSRLARKAKEYQFNKMGKCLPRHITPTDIDAFIEINWHFLYCEFKSDGKPIDKGQRVALERRLIRDGLHGTLFLCSHPPIEIVDVPPDITGLSIWRWDEQVGMLIKSPAMQIESDNAFAWWLQQWADHVEEKPNHFITQFRRVCGIYPGDDMAETVLGDAF